MFSCTKIAVLLQFPDLELKGAYMKFTEIRRIFSTKNEEQYTTIGAFWEDGPLLYEIEEFDENGSCRIRCCR